LPIRKTITVWDPLHSIIQGFRAIILREGFDPDYTFTVNLFILLGTLSFTNMNQEERVKFVTSLIEKGAIGPGEIQPELVEEVDKSLSKIFKNRKNKNDKG
jgi:hypothetical protein